MLAAKGENNQEGTRSPLELYPIEALKGFSSKRAELLANLGVENQLQLLFFYPRTYEDRTRILPIGAIVETGDYSFKAMVANEPSLQRRGRLSWIRCRLTDGVDYMDAIWFNQPWLKKRLIQGKEFLFFGTVKVEGRRRQAQNPSFSDKEAEGELRIWPIYPMTKGLNQGLLRDAMSQVLEGPLTQKLTDPLPDEIRKEYRLATLDFSLQHIHFPKLMEEVKMARHRLAFEELFLTRAAMSIMKDKRNSQSKALALETTEAARKGMAALRKSLPFELTRSQMEAINDCLRDLRKDRPMNRLLQGDVGSGKTMVAAFAMAYVAWCGGQSMLMAPTSILAEQHWKSLSRDLGACGFQIELLSGSTSTPERRRILEACESGECHILIGTHALLQDDIHFQRLDLTITDEQHRFGVKQRSKLGEGAELMPHRLVMSATPIPRTLALILYGDLDLTIMRGMPKGRQAIETYHAKSKDLPRVYDLIRREVEDGGQVYVVCPLIEESDALEADSAVETAEHLQNNIFPNLRVGLLHGQMKAEEKEAIMTRFMTGEIHILVSTTVVEVGVDNPDASIILIQNAERFGLAQLHQLRGRVGRGTRRSYCILLSDVKTGIALERIQTLCRHNDGFELAEEDLRLRGPGDFFGTRQHGLPSFRLVNLYEDQDLIALVDRAIQTLEALPEETRRRHQKNLHKAISERYPELASGLTL